MNANDLIEQVLGIPVQQSPVYTAKALLRDCYKGKERVIRDTSFDLRDLPFYESARDITFRRPLEAWMIGQWVHHYDKNSAYLSACSNTNTGIGDPVHIADGDDGTHITPGLPGIYRVTARWSWEAAIKNSFDGDFLPLIINDDQEWVTNDVLEFAVKRGYQVIIHEAWVFYDYNKVLGNRDDKRNWAKRIWEARQALKSVNEQAYDAIKEIAIKGVGSFATQKDKYSGIHLIHPNWWADVVGKTRVNVLANLEKFAAINTPVVVEVDGLYFVSRDQNYRTAVPGILDRMDKLGGYKYKGSCVLTSEMVEASATMTSGQLADMFKNVIGAVNAMNRKGEA